MNELTEMLGTGKDLTVIQMCLRSFLIFLAAYLLIRISGRRSFAQRSPLDNVIVILLGAILSRGVVGASPFLPVLAASLLIVIMHRVMAWISSSSNFWGGAVSGSRILLFEKGVFVDDAMKKALMSRDEVALQLRRTLHGESFEEVEQIYMERDGQISIILRNNL